MAGALDELLPIRKIQVDGNDQPFVVDVNFLSTWFSVTLDEANNRITIGGPDSFAVDELQGASIAVGTDVGNTAVTVGNGSSAITLDGSVVAGSVTTATLVLDDGGEGMSISRQTPGAWDVAGNSDEIVVVSGAAIPVGATLVRASGDDTGAVDNAAVKAIVEAGGTAVLESAGVYYDDGTDWAWDPDGRVITTDDRPAIWSKRVGGIVTHMHALPGCVNVVATSIIFRLPPGANWPAQTLIVEEQAATSATINPASGETIGGKSSITVTGPGDRRVFHSRGTTTIELVGGGQPTNLAVYADVIEAASGQLTLKPGPVNPAGSATELHNIEIRIGHLLTADSFTKGTAIVGLSPENLSLFDWQIFGSGSATGYLYWREAYSQIGWRVQAISTNASKGLLFSGINGGAPVQVELAVATSPFYVSYSSLSRHGIEMLGNGTMILRTGDTRTMSLRPGVGSLLEIDWQTASSAGLTQFDHATTTTPDATPVNYTVMAAASITDNRTIELELRVHQYSSAGRAITRRTAEFEKVGGTLTKLGGDASIVASGGNIVVSLSGAAASNRWELYRTITWGQA
jgi:hypothetical protein